MKLAGGSPLSFRFGPFEADLRKGELYKRGVRIHLRGKSFEALTTLLERPGEVVAREELRRRLWPEGVFVAFDNSLNSTVNRLRAVLGDRPARPKFIETLPRVGYRFIASVEKGRTVPPRLAVLPFENLNRDPQQEYFAEGVADALITALGNVTTLRVISRQSVLHLRGSQKTVAEIASELGTDAVVEGSVLLAGGRVRITAQLVKADPEQHLWARSYECELGDILTIQGQVARAIAESVELTLTPAEKGWLGRSRRVDPEAHLAYLKGRHYMGQWSRESFERALECFQQATEKDPTHALAYAHMADCYGMLGHWGHLPFEDAFRRSKAAALKSIALDDALSTAHWALSWATWIFDWDLATSEAELLRAIHLNPSDAHAHSSYAVFLSATRDDPSRAVEEMQLALDLDPLSQNENALAAWIHVWADDYEKGCEQARRTLELFPGTLAALTALGLAELGRRRCAEAIAAFEKAVEISSDAVTAAYLGSANGWLGRADVAREVLRQLSERREREPIPPRCFAFLHAAMREADLAFEWLERAYEARDSGLFFLRAMPLYDSLRPDPRFNKMLRKIRNSAR